MSCNLFNISSWLVVSENMMSMSLPIKNGTDIETADDITNKQTAPMKESNWIDFYARLMVIVWIPYCFSIFFAKLRNEVLSKQKNLNIKLSILLYRNRQNINNIVTESDCLFKD